MFAFSLIGVGFICCVLVWCVRYVVVLLLTDLMAA